MSVRFQIGDRVRCINEWPDKNDEINIGDTGTVCEVNEVGDLSVGVSWDHAIILGHSCKGNCAYGHGWYVNESDIELISDAGPDIDMPAVDTDAISALFLEVV